MAIREYLHQNLIYRQDDFQVHHYYDSRGQKGVYTVSNFNGEDWELIKDFVLLTDFIPYQQVAQIGDDAVITTLYGNIIIFENLSAQAIRQEIFNVYEERPYCITFKTAHFHTYTGIKHESEKDFYYFGMVPRNMSHIFNSEGYIRLDNAYDQKYYKDLQLLQPHTINPQKNSASIEISFDLNERQIHHLEGFLQQKQHDLLAGNIHYDFLLYNCIDLVSEIFQEICRSDYSYHSNYLEYYVIDELDTADIGIIYNMLHTFDFFQTLGSFDIWARTIKSNLEDFLHYNQRDNTTANEDNIEMQHFVADLTFTTEIYS